MKQLIDTECFVRCSGLCGGKLHNEFIMNTKLSGNELLPEQYILHEEEKLSFVFIKKVIRTKVGGMVSRKRTLNHDAKGDSRRIP